LGFAFSKVGPGKGIIISFYAGAIFVIAGIMSWLWYVSFMLIGEDSSPFGIIFNLYYTSSAVSMTGSLLLRLFDVLLSAQILALVFLTAYLCMQGGPWRTAVLASAISVVWFIAILFNDYTITGNANYSGNVPITALTVVGFIFILVNRKGMDRPFSRNILEALLIHRHK
jgi:hypothetical protein